MATKNNDTAMFDFFCDGEKVNLDFTEITHVGFVASRTIVYTTTKRYVTSQDFDSIQKLLFKYDFVKISQGFVVAPMHIDRIEKYKVYIGAYQLLTTYFYRSKLEEVVELLESKPLLLVKKYKRTTELNKQF